MQLQFHKSVISALENAVQEVKNTELTQEVRLGDGMPDIGRILTSWGQVVLRSKEWNRDEVSVSGGLMVWTLYIPEDGTEIRSVESWLPFRMSWDVDEEDREGAIRILPLVRFVDARGTGARKIMLRAGIAAMGQGLSPMEEEVFRPGELPEDVQLLQRTYPVRLPREAGEKTFLIDEELPLPEAVPEMEKLIAFTMQPEVTDRRVLTNKVVFKGNGNLHLVYRCQEGKVRSYDFELPFSQFAQLDAEYGPDAMADIQMAVTNLEADVMEPGKIRLKAGLVGQYLVDERVLLELTEDAYSPFRTVQTHQEELELPIILEDRTENVTAEQKLSGQTGQSVDVQFLPDFPRVRRSGENTELELPGLFQVLYYGADGTLQNTGVRWEGRVNLPSDEKSEVAALVQPVPRPEASADGEGINLIGQLRLQTVTTGERGLPMVTGLELGDLHDGDPDRPSLILTRPGREELWDIARRSGSTVDAILQANDLQTEPAPDRMLLIPVL